MSMKEIVVIDENKRIKNELPEEHENLEVNFARYYKYEFNYEYNGVLVIAKITAIIMVMIVSPLAS